MLNRSGKYFHHRNNTNGNHDSICNGCFLTVATASEEFELAPLEDSHVCDPVRVYQVSEYARHALANLNRNFGISQAREDRN